MNIHEKCSFRSGWLMRHMGKPCRASHGEDAPIFKMGFDARKSHGETLCGDAFETMVADELAAIQQETRYAA